MRDVNPLFEKFATFFCGRSQGQGEVAYLGQLDRAQLNFSIDSLKTVDQYATFLHENRPMQIGREQEWINAILWGGAYVGEVIRRNAAREYSWIDFQDFIEEYPQTVHVLGQQRQIGFTALLTSGGGAFTLPINKLLRFIYDGPADSVWFYATCEVRESVS